MPVKRRLDAELVRRKLARSRDAAVEMIKEGRVTVGGFRALKPASGVTPDASIQVSEPKEHEWASRGAHKLLGALAVFEPQGLSLKGKRVLDAGASTGGFSDVALEHGARSVVAVDVGYGQLIWRLQNDPRVEVFDRTNIRHLTPELINGPCDAMVGDLSFISLKLVLPAVVSALTPGAALLPMVKPQFEVGKERLGKGGVVRSPELRAETIASVATFARELGLAARGVVASPLPGPAGNVEYFLWLTKEEPETGLSIEDTRAAIHLAVEEGPQ